MSRQLCGGDLEPYARSTAICRKCRQQYSNPRPPFICTQTKTMGEVNKYYWVKIEGSWHRAFGQHLDTDCGIPITDIHMESMRETEPSSYSYPKCKQCEDEGT